MTAIAILELEHRVIENVLEALEGFAAGLGSPRSGPRAIGSPDPLPGEESSLELLTFVELLSSLAVAFHHDKEEALLYPALRAAGVPERPFRILRDEHDDGRRLLRELREAAMHADPWDAELVRRVRVAAHEYAVLLRSHIKKEETLTFRVAESRLDSDALVELGRAFAAHAERHRDARERLLQVARALCERYASCNAADMSA